MEQRLKLARGLGWVAVAVTIAIGWHVWFTPIREVQLIQGMLATREWAFADVSRLGPVPLLVPVILAVAVVRAIALKQPTIAGASALILIAFSIAAAFSISRWYLAASAISVIAYGLATVPRKAPPRRPKR